MNEGRRALVLVDGEHYPPVVRAALEDLVSRGVRPAAALFLGGTEKVARRGEAVHLGIPSTWVDPPRAGAGLLDVEAAAAALLEQIRILDVDVVVDLSDEPVLDHRARLALAARALLAGVPYEGADFALRPPARPQLSARPCVAVIGTGKRTGKTAIAGAVARLLMAGGETPVIVAMGRGGPPDPVVVEAGALLDPAQLMAVADAGGHAASDFYEDALTTGAATVGARRCGGGLAGGVGYSNVAAAVAVADGLPGTITVLEGSGAAIPPVHADVTILVIPGDADPEFVAGYLGPYRVLLADLVIVTMAEPPAAAPDRVGAVLGAIRSVSRSTPVLRTVFRPVPLGDVAGEKVFFATTAPAAVGTALAESLEREHGCEVVATSSRLADRPGLRADLEAAPAFDVLLVELKAAAVDVGVRAAAAAGARVVFCDNRPVVTGVDGQIAGAGEDRSGQAALTAAVRGLAQLASDRCRGRGTPGSGAAPA